MQIIRDFQFVVETTISGVKVELGQVKSMREAESLVLKHLDTNPTSEVFISTYIPHYDVFAGPRYLYKRLDNKVFSYVVTL